MIKHMNIILIFLLVNGCMNNRRCMINIDIGDVVEVLSEHVNRNQAVIIPWVKHKDKVFSFDDPMKVAEDIWKIGWWKVYCKGDTIHAKFTDGIFVNTPTFVHVHEVNVYITNKSGKYEVLDWNVGIANIKYGPIKILSHFYL